MDIHLLIAPPATGKTRACLEQLQTAFQENPLRRAWALVPDQLQADSLRARLARTGAVLPVQVATFGDLDREILEQAGATVPLAEDPMLHCLLQEVTRSLCQAGQLPYYGPICNLPGFLLEVRDRIAELKRALVQPDRLIEVARLKPGEATPDAGLSDLARIYATYQSRLQSLGWADKEGLSWLAAEALQADPGLLAGLGLLVVDGFDSFNPAQLQTLQLLAGRVPETWITLPGDPSMERAAHRRFARTLKSIQEKLPVKVHTLPGPPRLPPGVGRIEAALFEAGEKKGALEEDGQALERIEVSSPAEEAREALRWIKARTLRDGLPMEGCAVAVPDLDTYRAPLQAAATEFGLPLRFTQGPLLVSMPVAAAVADLLRLPHLDYPLRTLLDTLRSPFFDLSGLGLDREDAYPLEITSRYGQIVQGMAAWEETLEALASQAGAGAGAETEENLGEEETSVPRLPVGLEGARLLSGLRALAARLSPPVGELSLRNWALWLEELLADLKFFDCLGQTGEADQARTFDHLLAELAHSEALTGPYCVDYAGFLVEWDGLVAATSILETREDAAAAVRVLRLLEARGVRVQALAVLGLAEGVSPAVERADPFISEEMRGCLGMEPRLGQEQAGLFYQVVTRADRALLLARPCLAKDGENWEPSPYWSAVEELMPVRPAVRIRPEDARPLAEAASQEELLFWATRRQAASPGETLPLSAPFNDLFAGPLAERWRQANLAGSILASRLAIEAGGPYEGGLAELATELHQRYAQDAGWSPSRLESYATCPFLFFAASSLGLEIRQPPGLGYQAAQLGSLMHEVLEMVYREAPDPADTAAVLDLLPAVARRLFASAPQTYQFRPSPLWAEQQDELLQALQAAVAGIAGLDPEGGWQPLAFEVKFGFEGEPLRLPVEGGEVWLHGVLDRVDINPSGELRVIDYKSGSSHLAAQDLIEGRRLQLPLYALAARQALRLGEPVEGFYWKLLQGEASSLKLSRFKSESGSGPEAAIAVAVDHVGRIVSGVHRGDFAPRPQQGGCPSYCPASTWCWRFHAVRW